MTHADDRPVSKIASLSDVAGEYPVVFCDVWGVVHNGVEMHPAAHAALAAARRAGSRVVLLTNSPRPGAGVRAQLDALGFTDEAYDEIVTSGDVTRALIEEAPGRVFHIGPARDVDIFAGLPVERVAEAQAEVVVATGLFDDERETPADYAQLLARLAERGLPLICANPDIVVHRGDRLIFCAGALARDYETIGGPVRLAGKPHLPIYEHAARRIGLAAGERLLAIGDGLLTDIAGANAYGADALLIVAGIHGDEFGGPEASPEAVARVLSERRLSARFCMAALR
ncbi:TIGR01459 family HAD-type hydrolase [Aurantimonas sp. Leaf443]|uniref:TIGR01459 family HAD-type hydrolase n=1 Tax=Aurantimonas sp. Leaf443 TaxID=1736378 RepID=UPI0006FB21DC|nr:TIGR01459 family HAD-type hydrolase [Aurantimonas sp. Leaf443]KQT87969.1 HAD family hydrolase [Aurantimonas sp. Leaf443]